MAITPILTTAASGLQAASRRAEAAAHDIVNVNTPGARRTRVETSTVVASPAGAAAGGSGVEAQLRAGDGPPELGASLVELVRAETAFKANAAVVRTAEEISRDAIDILA